MKTFIFVILLFLFILLFVIKFFKSKNQKDIEENVRKQRGAFNTKIQQQQKDFNAKIQKQVKEFEAIIQKQQSEFEIQAKRQYGNKKNLASERKSGISFGLSIGLLASLFIYVWVSWLGKDYSNIKNPLTGQKSYYRLSVNPKPPNSRVKIMNIEPRYKRGIILRQGEYVIKVEHPKYSPKYQCVTIKDRDVFIDVTLNRGKTK
ncbi:hypothetical protein [Candidatus Parabeggiatoa sp. HSG14]|uniref:hypothetical protein n=1 Tax=Candidatus Parabeggiatoa sp. HSG14 TaxID=3055593 RepID=UPI0025A7A261|nr:hypothetical protein [Thiotrichales bacterium HSG14]